ncbi:hypothetical protein [Agreia sp. COWG]|uniref:hypothetical protein n=1 Tax=Agreia sp. COWG TaxID=2773266 RepID=UPI0019271F91|nr:hypothetical protein [Agreia sp. COWG]CAD6006008.1 conserved protein of unknown function [Agreia sp. COWG]
MNTTKWVRVLLVAGVVAVIVGLVLVVTAPQPPRSFGWFAYAPLSEETFSPDRGGFVPLSAAIGITVCAIGCAALTFVLGFALGRRRAE